MAQLVNSVPTVRSYDYVLEPSPVALPLAQPQQTRVVQLACGRAHSLVLTDREGGWCPHTHKNTTLSNIAMQNILSLVVAQWGSYLSTVSKVLAQPLLQLQLV